MTRGCWEGGYVGATYDSYDLLTDALGDIPLNHGELILDVVGSLPQHAWAQRDYLRLRPADRLSSAWEDFGTVVKHHRRYFFAGFRHEDDDDLDYLTPGELLDEIGRAVREAGLVVESLARLLLQLPNGLPQIPAHELRISIDPVQGARHDVLLSRVDRPAEGHHPVRHRLRLPRQPPG